MASRFEIVDEEYIEELKDKSETENTIGERTFSKRFRMIETCKQIKKGTRTMSSINDRRSFKHSEIQ